jgi:hypothetical protein
VKRLVEDPARDPEANRSIRGFERRLDAACQIGGEFEFRLDGDVFLDDVIERIGFDLVDRTLPPVLGVDVRRDVEDRHTVLVSVLQAVHRVRIARARDGEGRRDAAAGLVVPPRDVRDGRLVAGHHVSHLVALDDGAIERERLGARNPDHQFDAGVDERLVDVLAAAFLVGPVGPVAHPRHLVARSVEPIEPIEPITSVTSLSSVGIRQRRTSDP